MLEHPGKQSVSFYPQRLPIQVHSLHLDASSPFNVDFELRNTQAAFFLTNLSFAGANCGINYKKRFLLLSCGSA